MARRAEGWKLWWRNGIAWVRFTHAGARHAESTGERDARKAATRAAEIYSAVVDGRRRPGTAVLSPRLPLDELAAEWLVALENTHGAGTVGMFEIHVRAHLIPFFERLDRVTTASIADYARKRLGEVTRKTMVKERNTLRAFLRWLVERGTIERLPEWPDLPQRAQGVRSSPRKSEAVEVSPEQVAAFLDALPEWSSGRIGGAGSFAVRARFIVAWETALRPSTLSKLEVPRHYRKGSAELVISDDIDKVKFGRRLPLSVEARDALDAVVPAKGLIFGPHDARAYVEAAAADVGLPKAFSPYDLRHGRATQIVEQSANLIGAAFLLGHRKVTTTDRYMRPNRRAADRALASVAGPKRNNSGTGTEEGQPEAPTAVNRGATKTEWVRELLGSRTQSGRVDSNHRPLDPQSGGLSENKGKAVRSHPRKSARNATVPESVGTAFQNDPEAVAELRGLAKCLGATAAWDAIEEQLAALEASS
jgi:integrase